MIFVVLNPEKIWHR